MEFFYYPEASDSDWAQLHTVEEKGACSVCNGKHKP